jgi:biopolymer transport protein ExbD
MHSLEIQPGGELVLNGQSVTRAELELNLEALAMQYEGWIDFRPHPNARYEDFVAAFAVFSRTGFDRLKLDNRSLD